MNVKIEIITLLYFVENFGQLNISKYEYKYHNSWRPKSKSKYHILSQEDRRVLLRNNLAATSDDPPTISGNIHNGKVISEAA